MKIKDASKWGPVALGRLRKLDRDLVLALEEADRVRDEIADKMYEYINRAVCGGEKITQRLFDDCKKQAEQWYADCVESKAELYRKKYWS